MTRMFAPAMMVVMALFTFTGDTEACGRKASISCCYDYCPPCPCPPVHYYWDCVKNTTNDYLHVHITAYGFHHSCCLAPGQCCSFCFVKPGTPFVVTAFRVDGTVSDIIEDATLIQTAPCCKTGNCVRIDGVYTAPKAAGGKGNRD